MKRIKIMGLSIVAVLAMGAVLASGASAATLLTLQTSEGALKAGDPILASSSNLEFTTSAGKLQCSTNDLAGTLTNNGSNKDKASITTESSTGLEKFGEFSTLCKTTTPFGPTKITAKNLPWPTEFVSSGKLKVKASTGKPKKVEFESNFVAAGGVICQYGASTVTSTFTKGKKGQEIEVKPKTTEQLFKLNTKVSAEACPTEGKLNGDFVITSAGKEVNGKLS